MADNQEIHSDGISKGVLAIIELTAMKAAKEAVKESEGNVQKNTPWKQCKDEMIVVAQREVKTHVDECPFKRIYWMCLGGASVLSVVSSFIFNLVKLKWFP